MQFLNIMTVKFLGQVAVVRVRFNTKIAHCFPFFLSHDYRNKEQVSSFIFREAKCFHRHPHPKWEGNIYRVSRSVSIGHIVAGEFDREKRRVRKG
jgi:hypothetical protein